MTPHQIIIRVIAGGLGKFFLLGAMNWHWVFIGEHQSELAEALKPMLTDDWIEIEGKGWGKGVTGRLCQLYPQLEPQGCRS